MTGQMERRIEARHPVQPHGLSAGTPPMVELAREVDEMRRVPLHLWWRRTDQDDPKSIRCRIARRHGAGAGSLLTHPARDLPYDPVDLVLTVAGLLWPGLEAWEKDSSSGALRVDFWWGWGGKAPGAVVLVDGVLHLIHLDRDADLMARCEWLEWAKTNWKGPVLHHGIQILNEDQGERSNLIEHLGRKGGGGGCVLWPTHRGVDLRPFRADFGGQHVLFRPLGDGFRISGTAAAPLELRNQMGAIAGFWTWLRAMEVPPELRAAPPSMSFFETPQPKKRREVIKKSSGRRVEGVEERPLLEEVFQEAQYQDSAVMQEFGVLPSADLEPARVSSMVATAERELKRAMSTSNRQRAYHWRVVLDELEPLIVGQHKNTYNGG